MTWAKKNDDEATRDIPQGQMGLASSLFKLRERQGHPQPYVLLQATRRGTRVICLCDSGATFFNLISEAAYLLAAQPDPTRFDSLAYRLHPLQVGGIEEGRSAVQIVGQVMQTLYDPKDWSTHPIYHRHYAQRVRWWRRCDFWKPPICE